MEWAEACAKAARGKWLDRDRAGDGEVHRRATEGIC